jgi:hypothetical protein
MKEPYYIQCKFKQNDSEYTAYIPENGARVELTMELENKEGRWEVLEVYKDTRIDYKTAKAHERDFINQRKVSDI